jgi:cell wall-associated NlpC family hydrolase
MGKIAAAAGTALLMLIVLIAAAAGGAASFLGLGGGDTSAPSAQATADIPSAYLELFMRAAATCPGLSWTVLAGIGKEETNFGRTSSMISTAGAVGPMQFLPSTFAEYAQPVPPGGANPPTPWDPTDAVYAAARMLCANGARSGSDLYQAIYSYNHADWYVAAVLRDAASYAQTPSGDPQATTGPAQATAIDYAEGQLGIPYSWGAESPGVAFDCSGLIQAAYAAAGIRLPRVATDQYQATTPLPAGTPLLPGDLVFYGNAPNNLEHVGLAIGNGLMIDAPHTGAVVRVEAIRYPGDNYAGATRVTNSQ